MTRRVLTGTICQFSGGFGRSPCRAIFQDRPPFKVPGDFLSEEAWRKHRREETTGGRCPYWDHNLGCPSNAARLPVVIEYDGPEQEPVPADPRAFVPADRAADDLGSEATS